jgi:hypothetical protein
LLEQHLAQVVGAEYQWCVTGTRQFGKNQVWFTEPVAQFDPDLGPVKRSGQNVLRPVRSVHLPQIADVLKSCWCGSEEFAVVWEE